MTTAAVAFDFGGVLITPITNQIGAVADDLGVDARTLKTVVMGPTVSGDHPWHRAERGEIGPDEIQADLAPWAAAHSVELRGDEIAAILAHGQYDVVTAMLDRVDRLRADGVRTALLTNTFADFRPTMDADIGLHRFDVVIESFAVGARKPETAIYAATEVRLGEFGVDPTSIVYLDDFAENLVPAAARGWTTLHVTDPAAALGELDGLLGARS